MSWSEERVSLLTKLWGEGKTAAEIAKELGGVTRNAVIGKAHRLKLSGRVSPIQQNAKASEKTSAPKARAKKVVEAKPVVQAQVKPVEQENRKKYALTEINGRMCRWPLGDPRAEDFGFCGCRIVPGLPYCAEHVNVAYQPATRKRLLRSEGIDADVARVLSSADKKAG